MATNDAPVGVLFNGLKIFITLRVPQRTFFLQQVTANGGEIALLEKRADVVIADHLRASQNPPGSLSYTWLEASIRNAELADKDEHPAGPAISLSRPVGSTQPPKSGRNPYTAEDDRALWEWVKSAEEKGDPVRGNEIYKQLEARNARHPWQSWRDRYIKYLSNNPPTSLRPRAPPTPPTDPQPVIVVPSAHVDNDEIPEPRAIANPTRRSISPPKGRLTVPTTEPEAQPAQQPAVHLEARASQENQMTGSNNSQQGESEHPLPETDVRRLADQVITEPIETGETCKQAQALQVLTSPSLRTPSRRGKSDSATVTPTIAGTGRRLNRRLSSRLSENAIQDSRDSFTEEEHLFLWSNVKVIEQILVGRWEEAWEGVAAKRPEHTAEEWEDYYVGVIRPEFKAYVEQRRQRKSLGEKLDIPVEASHLDPKSDIDHSSSRSNPATPSRKRYHVNGNFPSSWTAGEDRSSSVKRQRSMLEEPEILPTAPAGDHENVISLISSDEDEATEGRRAQGHDDSSHDHNETPFSIHESRQLPEGEKENLVYDESGSPSLPVPQRHHKPRDALRAFGDPPSDFYLVQNTTDVEMEVEIDAAIENANEKPDADQLPNTSAVGRSTQNHSSSAPNDVDDDQQYQADEEDNEMDPSPNFQRDQSTFEPRNEIYDDEIIQPNLHIPLPELDGDASPSAQYGDVDQQSEDFAPVEDSILLEGARELARRQRRNLRNFDTQAILNMEPIVPDLDMPLPVESFGIEDAANHQYFELDGPATLETIQEEEEDVGMVRDVSNRRLQSPFGSDQQLFISNSPQETYGPSQLNGETQTQQAETVAESEDDQAFQTQHNAPTSRKLRPIAPQQSSQRDPFSIQSAPPSSPPTAKSRRKQAEQATPETPQTRPSPRTPPTQSTAPRTSIAPSPAASESQDYADPQILEDFMHVQLQRGFDAGVVVDVLNRVCMDHVLAGEVLELSRAEKEIPANMRGVWTDDDDEVLNGTDARRMADLERKHGLENMSARERFLAEMR